MTAKITKAQQAENERQEAIAQLRTMFPVGSTVSTLVRHVSASGMSRAISVLYYDAERGEITDVSYLIVRAGIAKFDPRHAGVKMTGTGMDMGFALAYSIARTIYADGFECTGIQYTDWAPRCPSNDHTNERTPDFTPGRLHSDPGYALNHRHV